MNYKYDNDHFSPKSLVIICFILIVVVAVISGIMMYLNYNNKEVVMREQAEAQRKKVEGVHDAMWKIIAQKAQVSSEYKESFDSIYTHIIAGRYSQGDGSLMKWITEANPQFDASLYRDVMDAVEIQRNRFASAQERMVDIIREHSTLCKTYPAKWFISNTSEIEYTVISSSKTKEIMESGEDDDVELFKKK